jgi:signal transduction histidine kinase
VLSIAAIAVVYIDPEQPLLSHWIPFTSGPFTMDWRLLAVMLAHVAYSMTVYVALRREWVLPARLVTPTLWTDVLFAVAIATMTEGVTSPSYPFFAFTVVASGLRGGLRQAMLVTVVNLVLYLSLIVISTRGDADVYIMRPVYLGITGYLVGYLGQQRLELQEQMRQLEVTQQRHRIARELHDGYAQALAGITLRLEGSRRLLQANAVAETLSDLTDLQGSVNREYDDLRRYARSLAGVDVTPTAEVADRATRVRIRVELSGSVAFVDQVLSIAREGIHNVGRHARASTATVDIRADRSQVRISIDDDGVGFRGDVSPWSIASRVKEIGGHLQLVADQGPGAHVLITLPQV